MVNNPHWFSYLRRRWLHWSTEVKVTSWQADYFAKFTELLTRLNLPLDYSDEEHVPPSGKLVEPLYWVLKEIGRGEN